MARIMADDDDDSMTRNYGAIEMAVTLVMTM